MECDPELRDTVNQLVARHWKVWQTRMRLYFHLNTLKALMAAELFSVREEQVKKIQTARKELAAANQARAQYMTQLNENEMVKKELDLLADDAGVYKLIGPVLVKQSKAEASSNVAKRIEFITNDMKRLEEQIKQLSKKNEEETKRLIEIEANIKAKAQAQAQATAQMRAR